MECKEGYDPASPLCAVCSPGYFTRLRTCVACQGFLVAEFALLVVGLAVVVAVVVYICQFHAHVITGEVLANLKIMVSFFTIALTMDSQFGVRWPDSFLRALALLSTLTFDLSAISALLCIKRISFFESLVFSTLGLVFVVAGLYALARLKPNLRHVCLKSAVYLLLFAYPGAVAAVAVIRIYVAIHSPLHHSHFSLLQTVVSVKIVEAFSCQAIDGKCFRRRKLVRQTST